MAEDEQPETQADADVKIRRPQKIYLKDVSFESPNSPEMFASKWEPKLAIEINNSVTVLEDDTYNVTLAVTATVTVEDKTAFLAEVHQAGIFVLKGYDPAALDRVQRVFCLSTLYPYACAAISELVTKGGFPQLLLAPINFLALYANRLQENQEHEESPDE